jgi:hypothetical protein
MGKIRKSSIALAAVVGAGGLFLSDHFSTTAPGTYLSQAEAVIGRPLTPLSVAGVARRTTRRAVAAGAIGYGAYAVGRYGYSDYYGTPGYTNYGSSGYYGAPGYTNYGYSGYYATPGYSGYASFGGRDDAYCASRYRSYDPASGTYLGYDGVRHSCP